MPYDEQRYARQVENLIESMKTTKVEKSFERHRDRIGEIIKQHISPSPVLDRLLKEAHP
ncbi:hypothetical protein [Kurthia sibirica]|uniref:hypothetical protein n=1 Tax=Kurthia sibirica TaxID=202750 RepID=UPI00116C54D9|nr:hypothetical protein [Kurthia sibirica]GEK35546.1 hypothetical protein KSI01_30790 [Kurthia sibirica]